MNSILDLVHLLELLMSPTERVFVFELKANPEDQLNRNAYHDWLLDQGRPMHAEQIKDGHTPFGVAKKGSKYDYSPMLGGHIVSGMVSTFTLGSGAVVSGMIGSGQIGVRHIASG